MSRRRWTNSRDRCRDLRHWPPSSSWPSLRRPRSRRLRAHGARHRAAASLATANGRKKAALRGLLSPKRSTIQTASHTRSTTSAYVHQLVGDREATFAAAHRVVALAQKFGLLPWRAGSLLLTGWATAVGSGVADAARLIDAEIDNATATGPVAAILSGLGGRSSAGCWPAGRWPCSSRPCHCGDRRTRHRILSAGDLSVAWRMFARRSAAETRMKRDRRS